jgi:hypothetical protein
VRWQATWVESFETASTSTPIDDPKLTKAVGLVDYSTAGVPIHKLGLPSLTKAEKPACGYDGTNVVPCSTEEYFNGVLSSHPVFDSFHSPAYSNPGFNILGYAMKNITGKSFANQWKESIADPLGLTRTYLKPPTHEKNVIVPVSLAASWFPIDAGLQTP